MFFLTTKFHIQVRLGSEIEAAGESRHFGCIGGPYTLIKIDISKANLLLVVVPGGFILCSLASGKLSPTSFLISKLTPSSLSKSLNSSGVMFKSSALRVADVMFVGLRGD
jgi:hypothetical protein